MFCKIFFYSNARDKTGNGGKVRGDAKYIQTARSVVMWSSPKVFTGGKRKTKNKPNTVCATSLFLYNTITIVIMSEPG